MAKALSSVIGNQITKQRVKGEFTFTINSTDFSSDLISWNISNDKNFGSASANFILNNQTGKFGESGASEIEVGDIIQLTEKFAGDTEDWNRFYGVVEQRSLSKTSGERSITIVCLDYISTLQNLDIDLEVEGTKTEITDETLEPNYLPSPNDSLAQLFDFDNDSIAQDPAPILLIRDKNHLTDDPQYDGFEVLYDVGQVKLGSPLNALDNYDLLARSYWFYTVGVYVEDILEQILTQVDGYGKYLFGETSAQNVIDNHLKDTFYNLEGSGAEDYMVPNYTASTITIRHQLASAVTAGDSSISLDSVEGLPSSGTGNINGDTFTWSSLGASSLEGVSGVLAHPSGCYFEYENEYSAGQVWYLSYSNLVTTLTTGDFSLPSSSTVDYIDKRFGRIILDSAISTSEIVKCTSDYTFKTLQATGIELNKISFRARELPNRYEAINKLRQYIAPNYIIRTIGDNKIWASYLTQKVNEDYTLNLTQNANYLEDEDLYTRVKMWGKNDNPTNLLFGDTVDFVTTGETYKALASQTELVKIGEEGNYWVYGNLLTDAGYINLDTLVPVVYINGIPVDNTIHQLAAMPVVVSVTTRTETRSGCHGISKEQYVKQHTYYYYKVRFAHTNIEPTRPIYLYNAFGTVVKTISPGDGNMDYGRGVWHAPGTEKNSTIETMSTASYSVFYGTGSIDIDYDNVRFNISKQIIPSTEQAEVTATFEYWTVMTPVEDIASVVDGRWNTQVQTEFFSEPPTGYNYAIIDIGSSQSIQALDIVAGFYKPDDIRKFDIDMRLTLHYSTDGTNYYNISDATKSFSLAGGESISFDEEDLGIGFEARYLKIILENVKKIDYGRGVWVVAFTEISAYNDVILTSNATLIPYTTLTQSVSPSDTTIHVNSTAYFDDPGSDTFEYSGDITVSVTPSATFSEIEGFTYAGSITVSLNLTTSYNLAVRIYTYAGDITFNVTPSSAIGFTWIYSGAITTSLTPGASYADTINWTDESDCQIALLMDEDSGSIVTDETSNNNDGSVVGAAVGSSGKYNNALDFNSSEDKVDCGSDSTLDDIWDQSPAGMTIVAWITADSQGITNTWGTIVNKATNGWYLQFDGGANDGSLSFYVATDGTAMDSTTPSSTIAKDGTWHHLALVWDGGVNYSGVTWYVDGVKVNNSGSINGTGNVNSDAGSNLMIGNSALGDTWDGKIDEFAMFNRQLTQTEVQKIMNYGLTGLE